MLRLFHNVDLIELNQMIHKTIDYSYPGIYPDRAVLFFKKYHSESNIKERYRNGKILVFEKNGTIAATGSIVKNEISGVFVKPEFQGQGLGKQIMTELEALASKNDIPEITLSVSLPSKQFYKHLNYQILENAQIDVGGGQYLDYSIGTKKIYKPVTSHGEIGSD